MAIKLGGGGTTRVRGVRGPRIGGGRAMGTTNRGLAPTIGFGGRGGFGTRGIRALAKGPKLGSIRGAGIRGGGRGR